MPQAGSARRPQVSLGVDANAQSTIEDLADQLNNFQAALNVTLLVFDNGATKAAMESARNQVAAGRADLKNVEQQVLFNAVQAYVDVLRDQEFIRLASNDVDRLTETLSATQNRFDVGEVTRTDVSQSQSRLSASRSTLATAEGQLGSRGRPTGRRSARCRPSSIRCRRCRRCRRGWTRPPRSASSAIR